MDDDRLKKRILEGVAGALLALAGVATSWSGYQASLWGGIQAELYTKTTDVRVESSRALTEAGQLRSIDASLFVQWLESVAHDDLKLRKFYEEHFRPEFKPAFDAWLANDPLHDLNPLSNPFTQPEYKLASIEKARELDESAAKYFRDGQEANDHSDKYVLNTVVFGIAMFFAGIAQQFRYDKIQMTLLSFSFAMVVIGLFRLMTYPVAG